MRVLAYMRALHADMIFDQGKRITARSDETSVNTKKCDEAKPKPASKMSSSDRQGPKLFSDKPRKNQLKQFQEQHKGKDFSAPSPAAASYSMGSQQPPPPPPPPPQPPKESFARRYKFLWPLLLGVNFAVGAYLFTRTKKKDASIAEDVPTGTSVTTTPVSVTENLSAAPVSDTISSARPATTESLKLPEPILESQQRELFKWILDEKRKVKPKDPEEKKRVDEEKAILKEFIKAKSIPNI